MSEPINYDWEAAVAAWNKPERKKFDDFFTKPESPVGAIPPATTTNVSAYGNKALTEELATLANTNEGQRNDQLNRSAFNLAQLVAAGHLPEIETREQLRATA